MAEEILRTQLEIEAGAIVLGLSVNDILQSDGTPIVAAETAGELNFDLTANVFLIQGEICDNETPFPQSTRQLTRSASCSLLPSSRRLLL